MRVSREELRELAPVLERALECGPDQEAEGLAPRALEVPVPEHRAVPLAHVRATKEPPEHDSCREVEPGDRLGPLEHELSDPLVVRPVGDPAVTRCRRGDTLPEDRGTALLTIAEAYAALGDQRAEAAFRDAADHIERQGPPRYRADAYRGWARVLRKQGRESEALDLLERATETGATAR